MYIYVKAADKAARRVINDGGRKLADANKAMNKARRMAKKKIVDVLEIDEDGDDILASSDYELLLSAAGAVEKTINISSSWSQSFTVPAGSAFVWKARVKRYDIGFIVREIRNAANPSESLDIETLTRYRSDAPIQGHLPAVGYARNITLVFDNIHSHLQTKKVVYWVACGENVSLADDAVGAARSLEVSAAEEGPQE